MADTVTALVKLLLKSRQVKDLDLKDPVSNVDLDWEQSFAAGTGAGQVDKEFDDSRSLADAASEDLDLAGVLVDAFGAVLTFTKIKVLAIKNNSATQILSVGGAAATAFSAWLGDPTDIIKIGPGAIALLICDPAGITVGAGTTDLLKIANSAGAVCAYDIFIAGI